MGTPEPEQPTEQPTEEMPAAGGADEAGDPNARDTGDFAEVPEDERADVDDPTHPQNINDPVDVSDVVDDGQVVDVSDPED
jgi:hypothetical protein